MEQVHGALCPADPDRRPDAARGIMHLGMEDAAMTKIIETLALIDGPNFWAGIILWDDVVIEAAPIVKFMKKKRWTRDMVREHCRRKHWTVSVIHQLERVKP